MRVLDHSFGIASSGLVVALSGISGPTRTDITGSLGTERKRAEPGQKHIRGGKQHSIQEITTRNRLEETEELIVIRALTHREVPFTLSVFLPQRAREKPRSGKPLGSYCFASLLYGTLRRVARSEEHTSELQSRFDLVCRLLLEKKNNSSNSSLTCSSSTWPPMPWACIPHLTGTPSRSTAISIYCIVPACTTICRAPSIPPSSSS